MLKLLVMLLAGVDGGTEPSTPARLLVERTTSTEYVNELLDDGRYVRFGTEDNGPVHVWSPRTLKRDGAVVIYVHGFFTDVDAAMREHRLTAQFRDSGRNAVFIVPEARSWRTDPILWPELPKLLTNVEQRTKTRLPSGPIVLVGHSGAYRTLAGWLTEPRVKQVLLVDGLYGNEKDFEAWLDAGDGHQLVLVGYDTKQRGEWLSKKRPSVTVDTLPWLYDELPATVRKASLVHVHSERLDHMGLVTDGRLLPWLLHAFR